MGLFGFIGDIINTVIVKPSNVVTKAVIGVPIFKKPLKAFSRGIAIPLAGAGLFKTAVVAAGVASGVGQQPATQQIIVPSRGQVAGPQAFRTAPASPPVGRSRAIVSGGGAAFSSFTLGSLGGGNPAWRFLGQSSVRSREREVFSATSQGRWVQSGHSVRLLR